MADFTGIFRRPYPEQVAAFRLRLGELVPTARWDEISRNQHDRAFMVAGAAKADLLADLAEAVDRAVAEGTGFDTFKRDFRSIVDKHGWHGWTGEGTAAGEAWRMRTIYRTNMSTTYHAGRYAQLRKAGFKYWIYFHGGSEHPRLHHLSWNGLVLPADHPFWDTHFPPNGWGCSCYVIGAHSLKGAIAKGGDPSKVLPDNWQELDPKTGAPIGLGKLWDYAPGSSAADTISVAAEKIAGLPPEIGASFASGLEGILDRFWPVWVAEVQAGLQHRPALVGAIRGAERQALQGRGVRPASAEIAVDPGLLAGPKARRHIDKGDALTDADWARLPAILRDPIAILRDPETGRLFYIVRGERGRSQLVVALDFWVKGADRQRAQMNLVRSAYYRDQVDLVGRVRAGQFELLAGDLG